MKIGTQMKNAAKSLSSSVSDLQFVEPVAFVYNPLDYAWLCHQQYLDRFANSTKKVIFLGMNPGPWGMAQTGIPFGEIPAVRDWMKITGEVKSPEFEHPKRPVEGGMHLDWVGFLALACSVAALQIMFDRGCLLYTSTSPRD